ncbi:MAG: macro domain-containing protein, partial [Peptococcaceae bacterium]|nr:macro domain-containing protein [Peptococcaceae bacterium]
DAIVNTAGVEPVIGSGTDAGIHAKAGPMLLEARRKIGRIRVGEVAVTPGFLLPAEYLEDERVQQFITILSSDAFKQRLTELGGYDVTHTGEVRVME